MMKQQRNFDIALQLQSHQPLCYQILFFLHAMPRIFLWSEWRLLVRVQRSTHGFIFREVFQGSDWPENRGSDRSSYQYIDVGNEQYPNRGKCPGCPRSWAQTQYIGNSTDHQKRNLPYNFMKGLASRGGGVYIRKHFNYNQSLHFGVCMGRSEVDKALDSVSEKNIWLLSDQWGPFTFPMRIFFR